LLLSDPKNGDASLIHFSPFPLVVSFLLQFSVDHTSPRKKIHRSRRLSHLPLSLTTLFTHKIIALSLGAGKKPPSAPCREEEPQKGVNDFVVDRYVMDLETSEEDLWKMPPEYM